MFEKYETSEIIRFINLKKNDKSKQNSEYKAALEELEKRSPLLAMPHKLTL